MYLDLISVVVLEVMEVPEEKILFDLEHDEVEDELHLSKEFQRKWLNEKNKRIFIERKETTNIIEVNLLEVKVDDRG